jgi:hypothetical protein
MDVDPAPQKFWSTRARRCRSGSPTGTQHGFVLDRVATGRSHLQAGPRTPRSAATTTPRSSSHEPTTRLFTVATERVLGLLIDRARKHDPTTFTPAPSPPPARPPRPTCPRLPWHRTPPRHGRGWPEDPRKGRAMPMYCVNWHQRRTGEDNHANRLGTVSNHYLTVPPRQTPTDLAKRVHVKDNVADRLGIVRDTGLNCHTPEARCEQTTATSPVRHIDTDRSGERRREGADHGRSQRDRVD